MRTRGALALLVQVRPELLFLLSGTAVVVAGARLARDGDRLAERTGLGAGWVGAILVAAATSLPEIATDVAAVRHGNSALAIGDLFGSSMANMLILAVADLFTRNTRIMATISAAQATTGVLAVGLTAIAAAGVVAGQDIVLFGIGWAPLALGAGYILGVRLIHTTRDRTPDAQAAASRVPGEAGGLRAPVIGFAISAAVILVAAPYLASSADQLARQWGIASGFFGLVFVAAATALPEVAVVGAAIKAGAYTLAVGNLFGSNCFNMTILIVLDVVDGAPSILANAEAGVIVGAVFAILLTAQALLDLLNKAEHRVWYLEPGPALMVVTYAAGLFFSYGAMH